MGEPQRNLAIYDDKVYVNTADAHVVALNASTGRWCGIRQCRRL